MASAASVRCCVISCYIVVSVILTAACDVNFSFLSINDVVVITRSGLCNGGIPGEREVCIPQEADWAVAGSH